VRCSEIGFQDFRAPQQEFMICRPDRFGLNHVPQSIFFE